MNSQTVAYNFTRGIKTNCRDGCDGHNSSHSMYYEGNILYSYGPHYPLAIRVSPGLYLVNCSGYSNTTARHTNHFYSNISHNDCVPVPTMAIKAWANGDVVEFLKASREYYQDKSDRASDKLSRARLPHTRQGYRDQLARTVKIIEQIKKVATEYTPKSSRISSPGDFQKTVGIIASLGDIMAGPSQKAKNDWKARMLKAGLEGQGLIMPEDWDTLSEDDKEKRLDGAIKQIVG